MKDVFVITRVRCVNKSSVLVDRDFLYILGSFSVSLTLVVYGTVRNKFKPKHLLDMI